MDGYHVQENPDEGTVSYWKPGKSARTGAAAGTEAHVSGTPAPDLPAAAAASAAVPANDGLARIAGQIATLSAQIAHLHSSAGTSVSASAGAGAADQQLEQIETAIDQSRLATNAEQDELERQVASDRGRAGATFSAPAGLSVGVPADESVTRSGGLTPVPQSKERNETVLRQLDGEITATQHALDRIGQAEDAGTQAQRAQLEHTLGRLRTARTAVEQRAARTAQAPSRPSEEPTQ
jgi:hypothetical protein